MGGKSMQMGVGVLSSSSFLSHFCLGKLVSSTTIGTFCAVVMCTQWPFFTRVQLPVAFFILWTLGILHAEFASACYIMLSPYARKQAVDFC